MKRIYKAAIIDHIKENRQMLFLMGPRQVGKTTTCRSLGDQRDHVYYMTWDDLFSREQILAGPRAVANYLQLEKVTAVKPIIVFDEIHKFSAWKDFLKGFYDIYSECIHIIVTGSARLDVYKKGGDSLMGRYFLYRFHPLSVAEIAQTAFPLSELSAPKQIAVEQFDRLFEFGGYPDPYLKGNVRFYNRWVNLRFQQLFQEEIRDLTRVQEIKQLEILATLLSQQVGQQTSYDSFAKKIRVSGHTIRSWLEVLSSLFYCFEVRPWSQNISRSLLKEPKFYLWDWSQIEDVGARTENFIASHLLKAVHFWTDCGFGRYELFYLRDKEQREVDFLVTKNDQPWFLVEAKASDNKGISPNLHYFQEASGASHAFQVVLDQTYEEVDCFNFTRPVIVPAMTFLSQLI